MSTATASAATRDLLAKVDDENEITVLPGDASCLLAAKAATLGINFEATHKFVRVNGVPAEITDEQAGDAIAEAYAEDGWMSFDMRDTLTWGEVAAK